MSNRRSNRGKLFCIGLVLLLLILALVGAGLILMGYLGFIPIPFFFTERIPCFDTQYLRDEEITEPLPEVRGYVHDLNGKPIDKATVEIYLKGYWPDSHQSVATLPDGGFVLILTSYQTDGEYIVRVIGAPGPTGKAYHTFDVPYTFTLDSQHQRTVVAIKEIKYSKDQCHLPQDTQ